MNYLIIGAGGIGGAIAAYLASGGKDTAMVARGAQLGAIRRNGLTAHTERRGELHIKDFKVFSADDDFGKADVIFVCVKGYSLMEIVPVVAKASHNKTVVIPILNSLNAGDRLGQALPGVCVLGGCIYASAFVSAPGTISQPTPMFKIVFGSRSGFPADEDLMGRIVEELEDCSIDAVVSDCIERDLFKKFAFISAFATTGSYFDVPAGSIQKPGEERELFTALLKELAKIAQSRKLDLGTDIVETSVKMLDSFAPDIKSSMHRDYAAGKSFEKQELIFDVVDAAKDLGVDAPEYERVAKHFGY